VDQLSTSNIGCATDSQRTAAATGVAEWGSKHRAETIVCLAWSTTDRAIEEDIKSSDFRLQYLVVCVSYNVSDCKRSWLRETVIVSEMYEIKNWQFLALALLNKSVGTVIC